jgi:drug/metabolite transporter (DMT)-like permease
MNTILFLVLSLIWGSSWLAVKINLSAFPPFYSAGLRFVLAGLVLLVVMKLKVVRFPVGLSRYSPSLVFGASNGISYALVYWAMQFIPSGLTAVLNSSLPFFSIIFAYLFLGERITGRKIGGSAVGFGGILLLFYESLAGFSTVKLVGELAIVTSAAIYALASVYVKKHSRIQPLPAVTIQMFAAAVVLLTVAVIFERRPEINFSPAGLTAFLYLSLLGSALAFYLYNLLILRMEISKLGYISMITPVIATVLGVLWLGEVIRWPMAAGLVLVLAGTALVYLKSPQIVEKPRNYQ